MLDGLSMSLISVVDGGLEEEKWFVVERSSICYRGVPMKDLLLVGPSLATRTFSVRFVFRVDSVRLGVGGQEE